MRNVHIDEDILSDLKEVMEADFTRLITVYFDDAILRIENLQQSLLSRDLSSLRKVAHSMKGSSSNIGAARLAELLQKMEDMAKQGDLKDEVVLLTEIQNEFQLVRASLLEWIQPR
jgi:HPt (histidine-containing phosphotransfer) domain-containing protein